MLMRLQEDLESAAKRSKEIYDSKVALNKYCVGDFVWFLYESRKVGVMPKFEHVYEGPFIIKKKYSELDFLI